MSINPFSGISPEDMSASQANQLFVEMHSDYPEITREGNTFITGARGCGKTMLIRCSLPDFLMVRDKVSFSELPYLAVCMSVKKTSLDLQELNKLLNSNAPYLINEHFMTIYVVMYTFNMLSEIKYEPDKYDKLAYKLFIDNTYIKALRSSGCKDMPMIDYTTANSFFSSLYEHIYQLSSEFIPYLTRLMDIDNDILPYSLPLLSFRRFIVPVFKELVKLPGFPYNKPIFLYIDDADYLSKIQTEILNTWIATRTQPSISIKVSYQIGLYKTFLSSTGVLVEAPHDYQEVNISYLYTTQEDDYYKKACKILLKRLQLNHQFLDIPIDKSTEIKNALSKYFLTYEKQEIGIQSEEAAIRSARQISGGRGNRENDDVRRYAIPNYIRNLGGMRKSRRTYLYAGLDNIVHLSSGIIRYLLDAAAKMYDRAVNINQQVNSIDPSIQDSVMREKADFYLFTEIRKSRMIDGNDTCIAIGNNPRSKSDKLGNLINAMGKTFHEILISGNLNDPLSGRAERKVFSIAISNPNPLDPEVEDVLSLGVRLGFLHESHIGNKEGNGRTTLYILNRCFAPIFTLDPTGFQGYLFMTNSDLRKAIDTGKQLRKVSREDDSIHQISFEDI